MKIFCVVCNSDVESHASKHTTWHLPTGDISGWGCQKHWQWMAERAHEFTTDAIREGRLAHAPDMLQRYRDGELSREFVEQYPEQVKGMIEKGVVTKEQVRNSKEVYKGDIKGLERLKHPGVAHELGKD